ncbi:MAG: hypothetical protein M1133_04545 [Armatimonadetes bacterium]|nr:hypothetical protein [Armatimonadota bacterium]
MLCQRAGLADRVVLRALVSAALAWIPLLVLSIIEGSAVGDAVKIPFLNDYASYGRLLAAIPLLIIAEPPVARRTREVLREFTTPRIINEQDAPLVTSAIQNALRRKNSYLAEIVFLLAIYAVITIRLQSVLSDPLDTWYHTNGRITASGWCYALVSLPIFQFLLTRWVWRLAIWTGLLWRLSRLNMRLEPIHPDRAGGLGFLGLAQIPFGIIAFAGGAVIASSLANGMVYRGLPAGALAVPILIYVILAVLALIAPLLVFIDKLVNVRASGILSYGDLGEDYAKLFHEKWIDGSQTQREKILGTSDIQSLADLANSYAIVQNMSIVPVDRKTITVIAAMAVIPMLPLLFMALPFDEIIARVIGLLG